MSVLVRVDGLWKRFARDLRASMRFAAQDLWRVTVNNAQRATELRDSEFWALRNVSVELRRGEVLAVLGSNGAGKSTLLKCVAGKLKPDRGRIEVLGRLGHLIELSAGFVPTLTGRDNVRLRGQLIGLSGLNLSKYVDAVAEFAEIDEFFDAPVQFYSSGMKSRLGFAASSMIDTDVVILDEVLAVGDIAFRMKCYSRIDEIRRKSAVILVSHSLNHIARLSTKAIVLKKGIVQFEGSPNDAIACYQDLIGFQSGMETGTFNADRVNLALINNITGARLDDGGDMEFGTRIIVRGRCVVDEPISVSLILHEHNGPALAEWNSRRVGFGLSGTGSFECSLGPMNLCPGNYEIKAVGFTCKGEQIFLSLPARFRITGEYLNSIQLQPLGEWKMLSVEASVE